MELTLEKNDKIRKKYNKQRIQSHKKTCLLKISWLQFGFDTANNNMLTLFLIKDEHSKFDINHSIGWILYKRSEINEQSKNF